MKLYPIGKVAEMLGVTHYGNGTKNGKLKPEQVSESGTVTILKRK